MAIKTISIHFLGGLKCLNIELFKIEMIKKMSTVFKIIFSFAKM